MDDIYTLLEKKGGKIYTDVCAKRESVLIQW